MGTESALSIRIQRVTNEIRTVASILRGKYAGKYDPAQDTPYKYVDHALEPTIQKALNVSDYIIANSPTDRRDRPLKVFEIGQGTGYLMYILRDVYGCEVRGLDRTCPDELYTTSMIELSLHDHWCWRTVARQCPVEKLEYGTDWVVATQINWMNNWTDEDFKYFIGYCRARSQSVLLFPNPQALQGTADSSVPVVTRMQDLVSGGIISLEYVGPGLVLP